MCILKMCSRILALKSSVQDFCMCVIYMELQRSYNNLKHNAVCKNFKIYLEYLSNRNTTKDILISLLIYTIC